MSRFLSLKLLATVGFKSRAVTKFRAAAATGAGSNLVRHFSLGQALGLNLIEPRVVHFQSDPPPNREPNNNPINAGRSIAVILSGCGVKDGTDVHEAIYTMMESNRFFLEPKCFAPIGEQSLVMDHFSNIVEANENRCIREESARMAWEEVQDLQNLRVEDHDGLIIPGGGGLFRNLTDYYLREPHESLAFNMEETLYRKLLDFYRHRKPMGFLGIASILAARVFHGVRITNFGDRAYLRRNGMEYLVEHANWMHVNFANEASHAVTIDNNYNIYSVRAGLLESLTYYKLKCDIGMLVRLMEKSIRESRRGVPRNLH